jgi:murein DD-endopeptidase MepM/ murein hydrolase activator NlpD
MRSRESLPVALMRGGLGQDAAARAADALADEFDTVNPHPGLVLRLGLERPRSDVRAPELATLDLSPRINEHLTLFRAADGRFYVRREQPPEFETPRLVRGVVHGSLYLSFIEAGLAPDLAGRLTTRFGQRLDLARDVLSGDHFRLVFDQAARGAPLPQDPDSLLYADISTHSGLARLYRYQPDGARTPLLVADSPVAAATSLLRTPVDGARLTSGFGQRLHPLLGYSRMHEGVDFGASTGTAVLAAGDGVIEEVRWAGDYGRWLKIRHSDTVETGYGHLSAWGPGMTPGARVRQGQVVAFVGATGLATGPHLHYEVFKAGQRIDPRGAPALMASNAARDRLFEARKADIDAAVSALSAACAAPELFAKSPAARCIG